MRALKKLLISLGVSGAIFLIQSCGPTPKQICFSNDTINLVAELFAERYVTEQLLKISSVDFFGGLLTLGFTAQKDKAIQNVKRSFTLGEPLESKRIGDNFYTCEGIFTLAMKPANNQNTQHSKFKLSYTVKHSKGEKQDFITVNLIEITAMK